MGGGGGVFSGFKRLLGGQTTDFHWGGGGSGAGATGATVLGSDRFKWLEKNPRNHGIPHLAFGYERV